MRRSALQLINRQYAQTTYLAQQALRLQEGITFPALEINFHKGSTLGSQQVIEEMSPCFSLLLSRHTVDKNLVAMQET